jgi:hypothetical protein
MMRLAALLLLAQTSVSNVDLSLKTDKACYFVGEPVTMTLTARNSGHTSIYGPSRFDPSTTKDCCPIRLALCEARRGCGEVILPSDPNNELILREIDDAELGGGRSRPPSSVTVTLNGSAQALFSTPGRYRLRLEHGGFRVEPAYPPKSPHVLIPAESAAFSVVAPPPSENEALTQYLRPAILRVTQFRPGVYKPLRAGDVEAALAFLRGHPNSLYAKPVVEALKALLPLRVMRRDATDKEREAHEMFKRKQYPDPYVPECP